MNNNFAFSKGLVVALNVFGKWRGNIAYDDVKDLTVDLTSQAESDDLEPGDEVSYEVTALNSGTQPTDAGTLSMEYDPSSLDLVSADGGSVAGNTVSWDFPQMESAQTTTYEPVFELKEDLPDGEHEVEAVAAATQQDEVESNNRIRNRMSFRIGESDTGLGDTRPINDDSSNGGTNDSDSNDPNDNNNSGTENDTSGTDTNNDDTTNAGSPAVPRNSNGANSGGSSHTPGYLLVDKAVAGPGPYSPGDKVAYTLTISNPGDTRIDDVVIYDALENGELRAEVSWPIDYVERNEKVTIDYEIIVQSDAPSGEYYNGAYASGFDAANAVIKSTIAATVITVDNPNYVAGSGVVTGAAGTLDTIEVLDGFNVDATPTDSITHEDAVGSITGSSDANAAALALGGGLSEEAEEALEEEFEQDIRESSRIRRFIGATAPAAVAAEGVYLDDEGQVLGVDTEMTGEPSQKLAYAVYPNFLHFDGMETETGTAAERNWIVSNWLIWTLFVIALVIGYLSFREKQKQKINGK
jgi:penicillin-binding protein 1A